MAVSKTFSRRLVMSELALAINALVSQLGTCPRCGKPEVLDGDIQYGKVNVMVATCNDHNYGRTLSMPSKAALAAMG